MVFFFFLVYVLFVFLSCSVGWSLVWCSLLSPLSNFLLVYIIKWRTALVLMVAFFLLHALGTENSSAFQTHSAFKFCGFAVLSRSVWSSWRNFFPHKKIALRYLEFHTKSCLLFVLNGHLVNIEKKYDLINRPSRTRLSEFRVTWIFLRADWLLVRREKWSEFLA